MTINISINRALVSIHNSVKNYSCHSVSNKKNINTFDVTTFIQMCTEKNKFWIVKNTSENGCVQVRKGFN